MIHFNGSRMVDENECVNECEGSMIREQVNNFSDFTPTQLDEGSR